MQFNTIEILGLVISFVVMLNTVLSKLTVEAELTRTKALHEAATLFDELERKDYELTKSENIIWSNDVLAAYKKSLKELHMRATGGLGVVVGGIAFSVVYTTISIGLYYVVDSAFCLFCSLSMP